MGFRVPRSNSKYERIEFDPVSLMRNSHLRSLDQRERLLSRQYVDVMKRPAVFFMHACHLTPAEQTELRRQMKARGVEFHQLNRRVFSGILMGSKYEPLVPLLGGPTYACWPTRQYRARDEPAPLDPSMVSEHLRTIDTISFAKDVLTLTAQEKKVTLLGGKVEKYLMGRAQIEEYSRLPSMTQLRGELISLLQTPSTQLVSLLGHPSMTLARLLSLHAKTSSEMAQA